ncbi:hypothetical protein [Pedosphaera parvula]|uniref:Uncharacterized protein n=1 Tax=Pedosphaera parvula (strain Ellin514) TaxID=320771 RepID=B9XA07_PEDPL|nr:hypothetical protein [Pedosphaera parvula]EEF63348.1 hypothetical protein Cflav_PD5983 [Pedosphaera parvula Ellin514]
MYQIQITIEELKPGMLAFKAKPISDQDTTDLEQQAGELVNSDIHQLIAGISQCSSQSELITGQSKSADSIYETRKDHWQNNAGDGFNPSRN